jgi:hypothetical protein
MRCPKGSRQDPPKSGNCVKKSETKKAKKCPKGTRKNKAGVCVATGNLSVNAAIKKWLDESGDADFFTKQQIAEIKKSAKELKLSGQQVYENLGDYAKGYGILVESGKYEKAVVKPVENKPLKNNLSVDGAIKKWLDEVGDDEFFDAEQIAEIKSSAKKQHLTGQQVYDNLNDYAKGVGILVDY